MHIIYIYTYNLVYISMWMLLSVTRKLSYNPIGDRSTIWTYLFIKVWQLTSALWRALIQHASSHILSEASCCVKLSVQSWECWRLETLCYETWSKVAVGHGAGLFVQGCLANVLRLQQGIDFTPSLLLELCHSQCLHSNSLIN